MLRPLLFAAASAVILAACASAPETPATDSAAAAATATKSSFERALETVDQMGAAGETQIAISRLMQLVGETNLTDAEQAKALLLLGDYSLLPDGYNAEGGLGYYRELIASFPGSASAAEAKTKIPPAEEKVAAYLTTLASVDSTRTEEFSALFNLGRHQEAIDLMVANDLMPDNDVLLAMYQIGYLCEDSNLTGRAYDVTQSDGTVASVRFCDFGK